MRKNLFWAWPIFLGLAFLAAGPAAAAPLDVFKDRQGTIDIAGGTAHIPVMTGAARRIMEINPKIVITVAGGGSGVGVQQVGEGLARIGNTGRPLKKEEIEKYGLVSFPFAIDGVAVVVHPDNPVRTLSREALRDVFSGRLANWQEVGGRDAAITLYVREDGSGTREVFEGQALGGPVANPAANVVSSNGAMKTAVAQDPNGLGYVGIGHLDPSVRGLVFEGTLPTQENAASGAYGLTRLLYMNTKGNPEGLVKDFIDYILGPEGREIVSQAGYIPLDR